MPGSHLLGRQVSSSPLSSTCISSKLSSIASSLMLYNNDITTIVINIIISVTIMLRFMARLATWLVYLPPQWIRLHKRDSNIYIIYENMGKLWPTNKALVSYRHHLIISIAIIQITRRLGNAVVCETQPGDCLFFHRLDLSIIITTSLKTFEIILKIKRTEHISEMWTFPILCKISISSNVLHSSGPNTSIDRRWNLVLAYNQVQFPGLHNKPSQGEKCSDNFRFPSSASTAPPC